LQVESTTTAPEVRDALDYQQVLPSVSVVIPCYNAEQWIRRSIETALNQQQVRVEIIAIDDGSTDRSLEVIKSFGDQIIAWSGPNRGACTARNHGLELATSEFVVFLDADDYLEPNSLYEWAACAVNADLVFGPFVYEANGQRVSWKRCDSALGNYSMVSQWLDGQFTPSCSVLWRRTFLKRIGGWNPCTLRNQDGEATIRALLSGARVSISQAGLGVYVGHPNPNRVSKRVGKEAIASQVSSYESLWALADRAGKALTQKSFARGFYRLAYEAFAGGFDDVGEAALSQARTLGLKGHPGTLPHSCLSHLLGLRNKLRFTKALRSKPRI
jgi:hypothetical protein